jgi:tellurite resistance protein TerC
LVPSSPFWILVGFHLFILFMLALDLGIFQREAHTISMRQAALWSCVWIGLAFCFALGIWKCWHFWDGEHPDLGGQKAIEFVTGYLVEKSLSIDNLFVFLVIFRYFGVPDQYRHRVLSWGVLGAVIMRATMILAGAALLNAFHWMTYLFGGLLLYTSFKLATSVEHEIDPGRNPLLRLVRRFLPVIDGYESPHFWVRRERKWHATPLLLVVLVIESMDVVFALDSIPAVFGVTKDAFIVYTSNIFAILGLRALYFLLAGFLGMFRYLHVGLALVLGFVGVKMIADDWLHPYLESWDIGPALQIVISFGIITAILSVTVLVSIVAGSKKPLDHPPEAAAQTPTASEEV